MKTLFLIALTVLLSACDSADEAVTAGNRMNGVLQKCVDHMKATQGDTGIPECNAMQEQAAYLKAKANVKSPSSALEAIDQKSMQLRQEAMGIAQKTAR